MTRTHTRRRLDAGFTLPEVLVAMVVSGLLISSMAMAFSTIIRAQKPAMDRIAESKDVTFVQTWLPIDLASSKELYKDADHQPALTPLPGTNVVTIRRADLDTPGNPDILIAYRYVYDALRDEWQLVRFEIRNPGDPTETVKQVGVAHSLPAPPPGWVEGVDTPDHAVDMSSRNPIVLREAGENIKVFFESGDFFTTGGAGLGPGYVLPSADDPAFADPPSPPSRCGGNVSVVIDASGSVDDDSTGGINNGVIVKNQVKAIIDNFVGTPTAIKLFDFSNDADTVWPTSRNAAFVSVLNDNSDVTDLRNAVNGISYGGYTNWEDGLRIALTDGTSYRDTTDELRNRPATYLPDLVIFITDGQPNRRMRDQTSASVQSGSLSESSQAAQLVANVFKTEGVNIKGIFIGPAAATYLPNLKTAIGPIEWSTTPENAPVGNALTADVFEGSFDELGNIFRQIFVAECGGTLTLQKRVDGVAPSSGIWTYTTSNGVRDLNTSITASTTLAYSLGQGASEWVEIIETPRSGMTFQGITCTSGATPLDPSRIRDLPPVDQNNDGIPDPVTGKEILVNANDALSCLVNSVTP